MTILHILRVLLAIAISGAIGWMSLFAFDMIKLLQHFEQFEAQGWADFTIMQSASEQAIRNMQGAPSLFLAAAIAGVLLSEIFKARSLLFYAGATGALAAVLAAALWEQTSTAGSAQAAAGLAIAGFVAGSVYWLLAGYTPARG